MIKISINTFGERMSFSDEQNQVLKLKRTSQIKERSAAELKISWPKAEGVKVRNYLYIKLNTLFFSLEN